MLLLGVLGTVFGLLLSRSREALPGVAPRDARARVLGRRSTGCRKGGEGEG